MTGHLQFNYARFRVAKGFLEDRYPDDVVFCPPDLPNGLIPGLSTWEEYHKENIKWLIDCTDILMLGGWPNSKGARSELAIALDLRMAVWFFTDHNDILSMTVGDLNSEKNQEFG